MRCTQHQTVVRIGKKGQFDAEVRSMNQKRGQFGGKRMNIEWENGQFGGKGGRFDAEKEVVRIGKGAI